MTAESSREFTHGHVRKRAPVAHPILDLIADRWSARAICPDRSVCRQTVLRLLEAARWAPSSRNEQPWRYVVFDDEVPEARERARDCLRRGNYWARLAPVLILSVARTTWTDRDERNRVALHDVGAASLSMALQAVHEGLVLHQMTGFDVDCARALLELPPPFEPVAMIAVGHPGHAGHLSERHQKSETGARTARRPATDTIFHGSWDRSLGD